MDTGVIFSITVAILSMLVLALIGWQIYSVINVGKELKRIKSLVKSELGHLSASVYATIFDETRNRNDDTYSFFKYGLLVILHSESYCNIPLCKSMIRVLTESFPVMQAVRNQEKAEILLIAAKISDSSIRESFGELHGLIITKIPSND